MAEYFRIFKLLIQKNLIVRKKHWKMVLFVEIMIPVMLFLLGEVIRMLSGSEPIKIETNTVYPIEYPNHFVISPDSLEVRFTPDNKLTNSIMKNMGACMNINPSRINGSRSEERMLAEFAASQNKNPAIECLGFVFETITDETLPTDFRYRVRTSKTLPSELYQEEKNGHGANFYFGRYTAFSLAQSCLDEAFINKVPARGKLARPFNISVQQMPYPPYIFVDKATEAAGAAFAELARLAFLVVLCVEVTFPTNEKYIGINILMSVNGVKNHQNMFSWLISGVLFSVIYLAPIVIMLKYFLPPWVVPYLIYGDTFIIWLVLTIHVTHVIAFGMHVTAYLWKPSHGVFAAFMVTIIADILNKYASGSGMKHFLTYLGVLSPNFLLSRIFDEINSYETNLIGVQWSNLFSSGNVMGPGENCIGVLTLFSLIGIAIHFFMALYIYSVRPGKYGVAKNPFFFLQKGNKVFHDHDLAAIDYTQDQEKSFERVAEGTLTPGIQIRQLKKAYVANWFRGTKVNALRGISVDFYKGQITALLGHNGAGKTTMMSILTGLTSSSEGMVFIDGQNVQYELDAVRSNLGLCPQENMVFPDLTVYEQVLFFGRLKAKNRTRQQLHEEVEILLSKVNLSDKKDSLARQLSGGQKRRMCLAMAVIGDAKVLILDEPTSGMDAESKREVWDIILKLRGEKTVLISTHDMEEADILGDRIAIVHSGRMRSYGTSMFLKKLYGDGQVEVTLSTESSCDPRKIIDEIGLNAQLLSQDDGQAVLAIPFTDSLPEALDNLEKQKKRLGITGLSVSLITLEQVFLRVTREGGDQTDSMDQPAKSFTKTVGFEYFVQAMIAFFVKKATFTRKNPWNFMISMLLPCIAVLIPVLDNSASSTNQNPISLSLDAYSGAKTLVYTSEPRYAEMYNASAIAFGATTSYIGSNYSMTDALLAEANADLSMYRNKMVVSSEFNISQETNTVNANGFYSGTAYLGMPATINMITNALVKVKDPRYSIKISAQRLPDSMSLSRATSVDGAFTFTMALVVFLAPAVALYVTQPLQENLSGVKHLQSMTGVSSLYYWGSMYIFDLFQYIVSVILLMCVFVIADVSFGTQYYHGLELSIFFLILLLFGAGVLPLVYLFSFWKKSLNTCINLLSITPLILSFIDFLLWVLGTTLDSRIYDFFRDVQSRLFLLFPHLSFIYGHVSFFSVVVENARCRRLPPKLLDAMCGTNRMLDKCCALDCHNGVCQKSIPYFADNPETGITSLASSLIWMSCSTIFFFSIIAILEMKLLDKLLARFRTSKNPEITSAPSDELVQKETQIVSSEITKLLQKQPNQASARPENIFLVHELSKSYGNLQAVRGISFRVKHFECFGLLGVNGAGKSTTFRMLTGQEAPRSGSMYLKEFSIATERFKYLGEMGYCPQQDALIESLNSYDHLHLFARLRGIPGREVKAAVHKWIKKLNLEICASQPSGTYSGGNKRRLNIAIALIGNPSLVLMDEPTTGVDPAARRSLWNTLKTCQEGGQSIILTSHSMEECEALCNRLVIMVKGQLKCVGACQELKQRFGAGYNVHVKLNPGHESTDAEKIKRRIETTLVCRLTDENTGFIGYHVTDPEATWTIMYTMMNDLKNDYPCIEDFAVLSSTLEQLFIQFARAPGDDDETDNNNAGKRRWWWQKKNPAARV